jgi:hypothetical protein
VAISDRLARADVAWLLTGSTGRRLLGAAVRPRDIDLEVATDVAVRAAAALGLAGATESSGGWTSWRAVGAIAGVEVDLSAGVTVTGPGGRLDADFDLQWESSAEVVVARRTIHIAPREEMLARAIVADAAGRIAKLADVPRTDYLSSRLRAARAAA